MAVVYVLSRIETGDSSNRKYENRVEFMLKEPKMQEEIIKFIFAEERRTRNNDK